MSLALDSNAYRLRKILSSPMPRARRALLVMNRYGSEAWTSYNPFS